VFPGIRKKMGEGAVPRIGGQLGKTARELQRSKNDLKTGECHVYLVAALSSIKEWQRKTL